jgi:FtsZ-binding cell division protein ZapB
MNKKAVKTIDAMQALVFKETRAEIRALKQKLGSMTRQRDAWKGRAAELKAYVTKYQKDLVSMRAELKELRKQEHL